MEKGERWEEREGKKVKKKETEKAGGKDGEREREDRTAPKERRQENAATNF